MEPKLQRRVQRYGWDQAAGYYEHYWQRQLEPAQTRLLEMADLRPGEQVLDVACGTGLVTFRAAEAVGPAGQVIGTDLSGGMVEAARQVARDRNLRQVKFERADAEDLRFPAGSFDAVLCSLGLMYVPYPLQAMKAMQRVLRSGGRITVAVWGQRNRCGWAEIFPIVEARVKSAVCPMFFQLGAQDALSQALRMAGFTDVVSERLPSLITYASPEEACRAAFAGGPVALAYFRFDDQTRQEVHSAYLTSIEAYRQGNGFEIPGEFVIASGRKP